MLVTELRQGTVKLEAHAQSLSLRGFRAATQQWTVPLSNGVLASPGNQLVRHFHHICRTVRSILTTGSFV